ncbi:hypothetical protein [uncultured Draconibacterium sp.]|uniref:hypothetical protein n=1 Tax=uncultured Draconibacterium sp. TaxID=1573823 RepID=UPI0029C84E58|nr:hypothetical protein [uncultured Draconibacterium sp.]
MPRQFSNRIFLCPVDQLPANIVAPYVGFDQLHSDIDIDPQVGNPEKNGNSYYDFGLRVAFSGDDLSKSAKYRNRRPFVAILFDTYGGAYQVGNKEQRLRAKIGTKSFVHDWQIAADLLTDPFTD